MMTAAVAALVGVLITQLLGRGVDLGFRVRRERDTAIAALRELIVAKHARGLDKNAAQREARAWARAQAVLVAQLRRRGETAPTPPEGRRHAN